jgi:hypothetical protein
MAQNTRIRVEPDIEDYLRNQAERVIGKPGTDVTGAELTTIANRLLYEHKITQTLVKNEWLPKLFNLFRGITSALGGSNKVIPLIGSEQPVLKAPQPEVDTDYDLDLSVLDQFDKDAA